MDHRVPAGSDPNSPLTQRTDAATGLGPVSSASLSGQRIGRFHIYRTIGSGGTSTVYQAFDTVENRAIALKVMHPNSDEVARRRFQVETQIASRLRHPNIVQTYQVGMFTEHDVGYIAMELVFGDTLADLLRNVNQLNFAEACCFLAPIAKALEYAHRGNLVHRDVKPSNILIRPSTVLDEHHILIASLDYPLVPLLTDFGIAWALDMPEITVAGRTVGSPIYMAPEQCSGAFPVDNRADIYSLGLILYRCVVGKDLFTGTTSEILYKHVHVEFDPGSPDMRLVTLPKSLLDLLQACLTKSPEKRLQTAQELKQLLTEIGHSTEIGPSGWIERGDPEAATRTMPELATSPWLGKTLGSKTLELFQWHRSSESRRTGLGFVSLLLVLLVIAISSLLLAHSQSPFGAEQEGPTGLSTGPTSTSEQPAILDAGEETAKAPIPTPELPRIAAVPVLPQLTPSSAPYAVVNSEEGVNVRAGPGIRFPVLALMPNMELLPITGISATRDWWEVDLSEQLNQEGLRGWVSHEFVLARNADRVIPLDPVLAPGGTPSPATRVPEAENTAPTPRFVPDSYVTLCRDFGLHAGFEEVFRDFNALAEFGCQASIPTWGAMLTQSFQWGDLFFSLQSRRVYVTFLLDDSAERRKTLPGAEIAFFRYPEWDFIYVGAEEFDSLAADPGVALGQEAPVAENNFFAPIIDLVDERSTSMDISLRSRLGAPLGPPERVAAVVQIFEKGSMILINPQDQVPYILQLGKLQRVDLQ